MPVWIAGISHYLPPRVVTNDEIIRAHALKMRASWVERFIGIRERRWVGEDDGAASDLAARAVAELGAAEVDGALFVSTVSPDYLTPSTAAAVKKKLGWKNRHLAVDLNAACAGHIFAMDLAVARLERSKEREALVVASEVRSRFLDPLDRRTVFLFGDGACAFLLRREDNPPGRIEWIETGSFPSEEMEIFVPAGGSLRPLSQGVLDERLQFIRMNDGPKIFEQTTRLLVTEIQRALADRSMSVGDFDFLVFHQGNGAISRTLCQALGVAPEKTWANFDRFGNTSGASVGIALAEAHAKGLIHKGHRVLLVAMGAGYHLGMASVVWGL